MTHVVYINLLCLITVTLCGACSPGRAKNPTAPTALFSGDEGAAEGNDLIRDDLRAVNASVWVAYPQGKLPDEVFVLYPYSASEDRLPSVTDGGLRISDVDSLEKVATGTADEITKAAEVNPLVRAIRIIHGDALNEYLSVRRLYRGLEGAGWVQVPNRMGLWASPDVIVSWPAEQDSGDAG